MTEPRTCAHPGAHVHGLVGSGPRPLPEEGTRLPLEPVEWGHLKEPLRPGERMSAAIGSCGHCGALVVSVSTWHPADGRGEHAVQYRTPWTAMYGHSPDEPVPRGPGRPPGAAADPRGSRRNGSHTPRLTLARNDAQPRL